MALCIVAWVMSISLEARAQHNPASLAVPGGGFETPIGDNAYIYGYQLVGSQWAWDSYAGVQRNGSGLGPNAPQGTQTAFVKAGTGFWQNINLGAGTYRVTFGIAQHSSQYPVPVQLKVNGAAIGAPITGNSAAFTRVSVPFKVREGGFHNLKFDGLVDGYGFMALIDDVSIEEVQDARNGSFETPIGNNAYLYGHQWASTEWTWSGNAGVQRNGSGYGPSAPEGTQTAFLMAGSSLSQNVTLAAGTYRISFAFAQNGTQYPVPVQLKLDSSAIGAPVTGNSNAFTPYASAPIVVGAGGGTYRLSFNAVPTGGTSFLALIDNVAIERVQPVGSGSFETPIYDRFPFYGYEPVGSGWNWSGMAGIQRNGGMGADAPEGAQTAFLQGASNPGAFSQSVTLGAGSYRVRFKAARRPQNNATPIQVTIDGNPVGSPITPATASFSVYSSGNFTVSAGSHTLGLGTTSVGGTFYSLIDEVEIENTATVALPTPFAPDRPVFTSVSSSGSQVRLDWNPVARATGYVVKRSTVAGGPYTTLPTTTNTFLIDGTLDNGVTYYYRVYALNAQNFGADSAEVKATPMAAPIVTAVSTDTSISLSWPAVEGATSYYVTRRMPNGNTVFSTTISGTTLVNTDLYAASTYDFTVAARNATGSSVTFIRAMTLPTPISGLVATANVNLSQITLTWNASGDATNTFYKVKRATVAGGPYTTLDRDINDTQFVDSALPRATYYYRVYAFNTGGRTADSAEVSATLVLPPAAPTLGATTSPQNQTQGQVNLSWTAVTGATNYHVLRSNDGYQYAPLAQTTGTTFVDGNLNYGSFFSYRVYASNEGGRGADSNTVSVTVKAPSPPSAPTNLQAVAGDKRVELTWAGVTGATSYQVYAGTDPNGIALVATVNAPTFPHENLINGTTYTYRVLARNADGVSPLSNPVSATPTRAGDYIRQGGFETPNLPAGGHQYTNLPGSEWRFDHSSGIASQGSAFSIATAPEGVQVAFVQATGSLRQTMTFGAGTYALRFRAAARDGLPLNYAIKIDGVTLDTLAQNNHPSSGYQQVTSSAFTLAAGAHEIQFAGLANVDRTVLLDDVQTVTATPTPPSAPTNLQAVAGDKRVVLTWTAGTDARDYEVYAGTDPNTLVPVGTVNALTFPHEQLTNGTIYYYRVRARNASANSPQSNQASATPIGKTLNLTATAGDRQVTLNWDAVSGATGYKIKRGTTDGGPYATLNMEEAGTSYTDSGLTNGTPYYYRVYAINVVGVGPDSDQASATPTAQVTPTPPAAPSDFTATAVNSQIKLQWSAVDGATKYKVFRSTTSGTYDYTVPLATVSAPATTYDDDSAATGTTYFYVVRAVNAVGDSPNSRQESAVLTSPPASEIGILYPQAGAVLSSTQSVVLRLKSTTILSQDRWHLSVDGGYFSSGVVKPISTSSGVNISFALNTSMFSNGVHSLRVYDGANHSASVSVGFQNDVSNVMCSPVFDVTGSLPMLPNNAFVKGTVAAGYRWEVYITDLQDNLVRYYTGIGDGSPTSMNVIWDGKDENQVAAPPGNYKIYAKSAPAPSGSSLQSGARQAQPVHKSSDSVQIVISGDAAKIELLNEQGVVVKTFENRGSKNFMWDGRDDDGNRVPNGDYSVVKYPSDLPPWAANSSGDGGKIDPIGLALELLNFTNNVVNGDSLIVVNTDCMGEYGFDGAVNAVVYTNIFMGHIRDGNTQKMDVDAAVPLLVSDWMFDNPATGPSIIAVINYKLGSPQKFVYFYGHGRSYSVPNFRMGESYRWFSSDPGSTIGGEDFDPSKHFIVPQLIADGGFQYGESGEDLRIEDPPIVVWMDHCASAGSKGVEDPGTLFAFELPTDDINDMNLGWDECFGVSRTGFDTAFIGWSGAVPQYSTDRTWDIWREELWCQLFLSKKPVGPGVRGFPIGAVTAIDAVDGRARATSSTNPFFQGPDRQRRVSGDSHASF